jgi:hypothetical protein
MRLSSLLIPVGLLLLNVSTSFASYHTLSRVSEKNMDICVQFAINYLEISEFSLGTTIIISNF